MSKNSQSKIDYLPIQELRFGGVQYGPVQRFTTAPPQPQRMTRTEANDILNNAVRKLMETYGIDYNAAFSKLQQEKPDLIRGYQAVIRRGRQ